MTRRFPLSPVLLVLAAAVLQFTACGRKSEYPPPSDRAVNDFAGILAPPAVERLEKLSRSLWEQSRDAVVVVTVESISPESIEGYAVGLFEHWGIGDEGKDNGVLVLVAEKERKTRIEVGYGLEGTIPDAEASRIVRDLMLPSFRRGDYDRGVELAVQALIGRIARERGLEIEGLSTDLPVPRQRASSAGNLSPLIVLFLAVLVLSLNVIAFRRRGTARGSRSGGFWTGSGGGFGGGFSGGGFGGFGGGMSGGGGASGGW